MTIEFEQQVLGCLLVDAEKQESREVLDFLEVSDFSTFVHRLIYAEIKQMVASKLQVDVITLEPRMEALNCDYGGLGYLFSLTKNVVSLSNIRSYANGIKRGSLYSNLKNTLSSANESVESGEDPQDIITRLSEEIKNISMMESSNDSKHIREACGTFLDIMERRESNRGVIGIKTGIDELDERLNGIDDESLVVIAGRPSMGKTLFCQTLSQNIAISQGKNILFFSMEMSDRALYERFVSGVGNVGAVELRRGHYNNEILGRVGEACNIIDASGIYYHDEAKQSVGQIRAKARRHKRKHPDLSMIFIDYLGLMQTGKADRHDIAIGNITRDLKELAKELRVPIVLIAQANRGLDKAARPTMSNIKDSSAIEADADLIMFVHRQEVVEPETHLKGVTEIVIAKDRHNDANGTVYLEKINGTFKGMTTEAVAALDHQEQERLKKAAKDEAEAKKQSRGFKKSTSDIKN